MSKTDKTQPPWVKTFFEGTIEHDHTRGVCNVETFEDMHTYAYNRQNYYWRMPYSTCRRSINLRYYDLLCQVYGLGVPRDYTIKWENKARRDSRDTLRKAMVDYNTYGETDIEPEPFRHRHCGGWYWT